MGFTIFWVIIINAIVLGIFSVDKLKQIPGLGNFFNDNPKLTGFVTITLPPLLVSLASMSVPELIFQVSKRAQGSSRSALSTICVLHATGNLSFAMSSSSSASARLSS